MRKGLLRLMLLATVMAACSTVSTQEPVQLVYSDDAGDPWNRLFSAMFTRSVVHRKTSEFADAGPATGLGENDFRLFPVSTRTFERLEDGDRAVFPFYPSRDFLFGGRPQPIVDPRLDSFGKALSEALSGTTPRTLVDRVLMQADLWAVFDRLSSVDPRTPLVARMIAKLALTRQEIAALPDHYALGRRAAGLPELIAPASPWQEIVWFDQRMHDTDAGFRQATRVFLRPARGVTDRRAWLDDLRRLTGGVDPDPRSAETRGVRALSQLDAAALVMQMLTIDTEGEIVPAPFFFTVQARTFTPANADGTPSTTAVEHELSRTALRKQLAGGFRTIRNGDPAYVPSAGNDYGFASPHFGSKREPILGTLETRCAACHGRGPHLFTFSLVEASPSAQVRLLDQPNQDRAQYVAEKKKTREDYKRLRALLDVTR